MSPVIVIPAFSRALSLLRLLESLARAEYPEIVKLIISLEGGASDAVIRIAKQFSSPKLSVSVIFQENRLGLRKHIIACGDLALKYGSVIVLEDDLAVDRYFYHYAVAALDCYAENENIAGVALTGIEFNDSSGLPFKPLVNGYSTYLVKIPCSSGQCWTSAQWARFKSWYADSSGETVCSTEGLPDSVKEWPESSWKKYFAAYICRENLYFVYPYQAYSTNCSDPGGSHILEGADYYQVSFASQNRQFPTFDFCPVSKPDVAYDAFLEPCGEYIFSILKMQADEVEIDIYGVKPASLISKKKFILTSRRVLNSVNRFPKRFRPVEHNFSYPSLQNFEDRISLSEIAALKSIDVRKPTLIDYSYYTGINFFSMALVRDVLLVALPSIVAKRIRFALRKVRQ